MAFSLRRTVKYLFKEIKSNSKDIPCVHGLRSVFMIFLYFAHQIIPMSRIPYANRVAFTEVNKMFFRSMIYFIYVVHCLFDHFSLQIIPPVVF